MREPGRNDPCPCGSGRKYKACCLGKATAADPVDAALQRGLALEKAGRTGEAIGAYVAISAGSAEANSRLGHLRLAAGHKPEAIAAFRAARTLSDAPDRRMDLVRALMLEDRDAEAEAELREVLLRTPDSHDALWGLGRLLLQAGRFAEAEARLERAASLNPRNAGAWYDLVRTRRMTDADRPLIARMQAALGHIASADERAKLHFSLGKVFDDLGDPAQAMRHFTRANAEKATIVRLDRDALECNVSRLIETYTPQFIARHRARGHPSAKPVFVVGMPRSGTSLVEQILSSHPEVAGGGERPFWADRDPVAGRGAPIGLMQGATAQACLAELDAIATDRSRVVDKNPYNFFAAGLVHLVFPNAVIFHCRRAGIDSCLSIFSNSFAPRTQFSTAPDDLVFYYRQYERLPDHWREVLPSDRWIDVDYRALVEDPEPLVRRMVAALGLAWDPACLEPESNDRPVRTLSLWQVRQPINAHGLDRWRRYEPWLGPLKALAPELVA